MRGPLTSLKYIQNQRRDSYRAAIVVSRKVHKSAVVRNRIRRRIFTILESYSQALPNYDMAIIVYDVELKSIEFDKLESKIADCLAPLFNSN